ncbi:MAG: DEAD/DEAH box helicase family protein, partial [Erysipelotrichaceae bacterium]|nr:DEAD/DEAH box helicase family protein [Erysipelotrichaceae bacterium]
DRRKERLLQIYEDNYASFLRRKYDGSFLSFPGMNKNISLFDYQKNAVARILFSKNVLLAHDVGTGKTYEMVAAGMELKRIGLSKKNLFVVPNNILGQWEKTFREIYPTAKLLVISPKEFTPKKKQASLEMIRDNDYDGIIMAYSCFDSIPLSDDFMIRSLEEKKMNIVREQASVTGDVGILEQRKRAINKKLRELKLADKNYEAIYFDDLGISRLFVDEAHNYKNVPIETKMSAVLGVNALGSKKCRDMLDKVRYIQKHNNGGGVVMATGTPITNSVTEAYIIQLYLQSGELNLLDLASFDAWAGMFGETVSDYEIDVATSTYRYVTRFCRFHNLPELTNLLSNVADFHKADAQSGIPDFAGYTDLQIEKTKEFEEVLASISERADRVRKREVGRKQDNMLKITTDGRKAALDLRLLDESKYPFSVKSKVAQCAKNIFMEYCSGNDDRSTQLVFCDSSTPKEEFNMYDELSRLLIGMGIPAQEIAYIHDANTDKQRNSLYELVRKGEVRILIGSTFKLGLGVNVQDRIRALHHLDIPWRPADMTQREGRILRQGNLNRSVSIYRYVTEGSFDAYSWQLLETKQKFISDLLSGAMEERDGDEIDDVVLSYGEIKALAIGNPLIKERVEIINELSKLHILQNKSVAVKLESQKELLELPSRMSVRKEMIARAKEDFDFLETLDLNEEKDLSRAERETETAQRRKLREQIDEALAKNFMMPNDRHLMEYDGFEIMLPKDMSSSTPYLIAQRRGRYRIDMGKSQTGNLIRLDNFFAGFYRVVRSYEEELEKLKRIKSGLEEELLRKDDIYEKIGQLKINLNNINERLGLNNE